MGYTYDTTSNPTKWRKFGFLKEGSISKEGSIFLISRSFTKILKFKLELNS